MVKFEHPTYSGSVGSNISMVCIENNFRSLPYFDWIRWDKLPGTYPHLDIDNGTFQVIPHENSTKYKIEKISRYEGDMFASNFTIYNLREADAGLYACVICGNYGRDFKGVLLNVSKAPISVPGK